MAAKSADVVGKKHAGAAARRKLLGLRPDAGTNPPRRSPSASSAAPLRMAIGVAIIGAALRRGPAEEDLEPAELYGDFA